MEKGLIELMFACFFLSQNHKEDLYGPYGNAAVVTDICDDLDSCQLEPDELLPGELTAVTFIVGCYTVRSALKVYKACDRLGLEIPADKEELKCVKADLNRVKEQGGGIFDNWVGGLRSFPWEGKLCVTSEISAKHSSDPYGAFADGFKYICRGGHDLNNKGWSHSISSIYTLKKNNTISDNEADLFVGQVNHYITATTRTLCSLTSQGMPVDEKVVELEKMIEAAKKAVKVAANAAVEIGAIPRSFADVPALIKNQVVLMTSIAVIFKIDIEKDRLRTLVGGALGVGDVGILGNFFGRTIFANLFKLSPSIGMLTIECIRVPIKIITYGMGMAFIEVCKAVKVGKLQESDITSEKGKAMFKEYFTSYSKYKSKEVS